MKMTHTKSHALMHLSPSTFNEIKAIMEQADYADTHFFVSAGGVMAIDMDGIMLVEDNTPLTAEENDALAAAIDRMDWPEINAFQEAIGGGRSDEDPLSIWLRALSALFGVKPNPDRVERYREAARRMVEQAAKRGEDADDHGE